MTSSFDVSSSIGAWQERACSLARGGEVETQVARATAVDHQILRPSRSVDKEAVMAACVHEHDLKVRNLRRRVVDFLELTAARGGTWLAFG